MAGLVRLCRMTLPSIKARSDPLHVYMPTVLVGGTSKASRPVFVTQQVNPLTAQLRFDALSPDSDDQRFSEYVEEGEWLGLDDGEWLVDESANSNDNATDDINTMQGLTEKYINEINQFSGDRVGIGDTDNVKHRGSHYIPKYIQVRKERLMLRPAWGSKPKWLSPHPSRLVVVHNPRREVPCPEALPDASFSNCVLHHRDSAAIQAKLPAVARRRAMSREPSAVPRPSPAPPPPTPPTPAPATPAPPTDPVLHAAPMTISIMPMAITSYARGLPITFDAAPTPTVCPPPAHTDGGSSGSPKESVRHGEEAGDVGSYQAHVIRQNLKQRRSPSEALVIPKILTIPCFENPKLKHKGALRRRPDHHRRNAAAEAEARVREENLPCDDTEPVKATHSPQARPMTASDAPPLPNVMLGTSCTLIPHAVTPKPSAVISKPTTAERMRCRQHAKKLNALPTA